MKTIVKIALAGAGLTVGYVAAKRAGLVDKALDWAGDTAAAVTLRLAQGAGPVTVTEAQNEGVDYRVTVPYIPPRS